jgi:hypothetical protein
MIHQIPTIKYDEKKNCRLRASQFILTYENIVDDKLVEEKRTESAKNLFEAISVKLAQYNVVVTSGLYCWEINTQPQLPLSIPDNFKFTMYKIHIMFGLNRRPDIKKVNILLKWNDIDPIIRPFRPVYDMNKIIQWFVKTKRAIAVLHETEEKQSDQEREKK